MACSKKIVSNLTSFLSVKSVQVNVIGGKTIVMLGNGDDMEKVSQKVTSLGFNLVT